MSTVEIVAPGGDLREELQLTAFAEFGVYVYRSRRLHLAIRCGGKPGPHAHDDQLGFELAIDGEDWIVDPGSYVLDAAPAWHNAYRAASAHAGPAFDGTAVARCVRHEPTRFVGERRRTGSTSPARARSTRSTSPPCAGASSAISVSARSPSCRHAREGGHPCAGGFPLSRE